MSTYTNFTMSLQPDPGTNHYDGTPIYVVMVSFGRSYPAPLRCTGRSVRSAFDEAIVYIESLVSHMCEECATQVEGYDEAFHNSGVCQNCHDQMQRERGN